MLDRLVSKIPNGVCFGNAKDECLNYFGKTDGEVVIVSSDSEYFALGKSIKDGFENVGVKVSTLVLDDEFIADVGTFRKLFAFSMSTELIVAVGKCEIINLARYYASIFKTNVVAVPTDVCFSSVFAGKTILKNNCVPQIMPCDKPKLVVIDLVFMAGLKKQAFADAFCEVSSKLLALIDYEAELAINGDLASPVASRAFSAINNMAEINAEGSSCHLKIINAELRLGLLASKNAEWFFGSEYFVSLVLTAMKSGSMAENGFNVIAPIIKLYEGFLMCDMVKTLVAPNYNQRLNQLALIINASELDVVENYSPMSFESIVVSRNRLVEDNLLTFVKKCSEVFRKLENSYKYVYKGKQKRADIESRDLRRVLQLSPYLMKNGILKLMNDSGVCECLG